MAISTKKRDATIELGVYDSETHLGDLRISRGTVEWCKGRTQKGGGIKRNWRELISFFEGRDR